MMYFKENLFIFSKWRVQTSEATNVMILFQGERGRSTGKGYTLNFKAHTRFVSLNTEV